MYANRIHAGTTSIILYDKHLKRTKVTESLGTYIDQFLSWDIHIEKLIQKFLIIDISAISRLKPFVCRNTSTLIYNKTLSAYNFLVITYFDFCCELWISLVSH